MHFPADAVTLSFHRSGDVWTMTVTANDEHGAQSCFRYHRTEPAGVIRYGQTYEDKRGREIRTGTVLADNGSGHGVAWPADIITDAQLDEWAAGHHKGRANSVDYLRPLTPAQRALAVHDANCRMNIAPGHTFSSAVYASARDVAAGRTPYLDENARLMSYDPTGEKAAASARRGESWGTFRNRAR